MAGRQKIEAAFSARGSPETPVVICYEGIFIRDHWDEVTGCPWWYGQSPDVEQQLAWRRAAIRRIGQDWFVLPACLPRAQREHLRVEVRPGCVFRVDTRSGLAQPLERPQIGGWTATNLQSVRPDDPPLTPAAIDALLPLPLEDDLDEFVRDGRADLAEALLAEFGRDLLPICHVSTPLWNCYGLWGFEAMMTLVADQPDLVAYACGRLLALRRQQVREAAALGAAAIWIEDCLTDMVSPAVFESIHLPHLVALVDEIRAAGMKSIYYFCGNPAGKWDLILAAGADAISLEESKKNFTIDIEEVVARAAGRCAVLGNLDAVGVLQDASEAQLRAEIARQIAAGQRNANRFILSLGSPVTPATPLSRVQAYCRVARELAAPAA